MDAICATSSFSRWTVSRNVLLLAFAAGGGAPGAGGVKRSPSTRIFSLGRYAISMFWLCARPGTAYISMTRVPSLTAYRSFRVSKTGALGMSDSLSGCSVRGAGEKTTLS